MSLYRLTPADCINFYVSSDNPVTETLIVTNISPNPIVFKIKTTSPARYIVKPNQGYVLPNEPFSISIGLKTSGVTQETSHKFLMQATDISNCEDLKD